MAANSTRLIAHSIIKKPFPWFAKPLMDLLPTFAAHLFLSEIFDGDVPYLYKQSRNNKLALQKGKQWMKEYYLPAQSDRYARIPLKMHQG